jgi:20S proteasome alpha/beta subunit
MRFLEHSIEKIIEIDFHVAAAMSGLAADARILFEHARVESQGHRFTYDEPMKVSVALQLDIFVKYRSTCRHGPLFKRFVT